jgi:hypothetical protein
MPMAFAKMVRQSCPTVSELQVSAVSETRDSSLLIGQSWAFFVDTSKCVPYDPQNTFNRFLGDMK